MGSVVVTGLGRRNLLIGIVLVTLIFGAAYLAKALTSRPPADLLVAGSMDENIEIGRIGSGFFSFEIADTSAERTKGLSGRTTLSDTKALLFVFDTPGKECIWMKDMKFSIDILWFDSNKKLVHEKRNVSPDTFPEKFCPPVDTKYIVETAAGVAEKNHLKIGDKLEIKR